MINGVRRACNMHAGDFLGLHCCICFEGPMMLRLLFLAFVFVGCNSTVDKTERLQKSESFEMKTQSTDKGTNSYSGDPLDNITISASGNARVDLTVGNKASIKKNEKRDTATEEEAESSFSVDYYLRSIPTTGWALLILAMCIFLGCIWWFIKTTMIGRAFDGGVAKGLELINESIDLVRDKLSDAQKGTDLHADLQHELARLRKKEGELKHMSRKG